MQEKINEIKEEIDNLVVNSLEELEAFRLKYLSKKGLIASLFADLRNVPNEEKKSVGLALNELKESEIEKVNQLNDSFTHAFI